MVTWRCAQMVLLSAQACRGEDCRGDFHQRGPGPGCDPQPQRRRLTTPPRSPASSTSTRSPTARSYPTTPSPKSSSAGTNSARSTSSPPRAAVGRARRTAHGPRPRPRRRATYTRPHGVRHVFAALDLGKDKLYDHIKPMKNRTRFLEFCRCLRSLYPSQIRIAIALDKFFPHLTTKKDSRVGDWAAANNVELACTPTNSGGTSTLLTSVCARSSAGRTSPEPHRFRQAQRSGACSAWSAPESTRCVPPPRAGTSRAPGPARARTGTASPTPRVPGAPARSRQRR